MQNKKCKMQNYGMDCVHVFAHFRRKYLNFAFCILHSAFERQLVKLQFDVFYY